jgi:NTP pyrophosphatase (non-canonical NTP hydrolase)
MGFGDAATRQLRASGLARSPRHPSESNEAVNRTEHLLTCLAEECAEVGQRVSKALRFGLAEVQPGQPSNNAERITEELGDLISVVGILISEGVIDEPPTDYEGKRAKIERFMSLSHRSPQ